MIEVSAEAIERVQQILSGVPKGAERALSNAINRGLGSAKTQAFRKVREVYAVKQGDLSGATVTRVQKASTGNVSGYISFSGVKLPLYKFNVSPKVQGTEKKVKARLKKGSWTIFEDAFVAQMENGHIGVFERTGEQGIKDRLAKVKEKGKEGTKHTEKIEQFMGLSGAQMVGNGEVIEKLSRETQEVINRRLEHEIERILNGYGG